MGDGGRFLIDYGLDMLANSNAAVMLYLNQMQSSQSFADFHEAVNAADSEQNHPLQMDFRQLGLGAQILRALGVQKMKPHVSSHRTMKGLAGYGLEVVDTVMIEAP
jgi:3,4-dihydroxy 2-butanone 4-phosphate synthase/GTP cyclohydrolase II